MGAPSTASIVDITALNTVTLREAFQFGKPGELWTLDPNFRMEVKASRDDPAALATWTTGAGTIVIDDSVQRIIHFNVPDTAIQAALPVGEYVYDLIMYDGSVPPIRTVLMQGKLFITQGVTES